jgi:hypothetical protein
MIAVLVSVFADLMDLMRLGVPGGLPTASGVSPPSVTPRNVGTHSIGDSSASIEDSSATFPEALEAIANVTGASLVRCNISGFIPYDAIWPFDYFVRVDRVVYGVVDDIGTGAVMRQIPAADAVDDRDAFVDMVEQARQPVAVVSWRRDGADGPASCKIEPPTRITVAGIVYDHDGHVFPQASVHGCDAAGVITDQNGRFAFESWRGPACTLQVNATGIPNSGLQIERDHDVLDLVLQGPESGAAYYAIGEEVRRLEDLRVAPGPADLALAMPGLSLAARQTLQGWSASDRRRMTDEIVALRQFLALGREPGPAAALQDSPSASP